MLHGSACPGGRTGRATFDCDRGAAIRGGQRPVALERLRRGPGTAGSGQVSRVLREIAVPFVAAAPAGVRVRARLRVSAGMQRF